MVKFVVAVKCVVKCVVKLKHVQIGTKIGVVVDIDSMIMVGIKLLVKLIICFNKVAYQGSQRQ